MSQRDSLERRGGDDPRPRAISSLGRTGEEVSVIGLGGHHIGRQKAGEESIRIVRAAIDARYHLHGQLLGLP